MDNLFMDNLSMEKLSIYPLSFLVQEMKREFQQQKTRMATMEDNINTILEIMISRNQPVGRF
jgi:hypothetical protein